MRARGGGAVPGGGAAPHADFEQPYGKLYAESLDPFRDFAAREAARTVDRLGTADRLTLHSAGLFLGSPVARKFLFVYMVTLHALISATLWHFVHFKHSGGVGCGEAHENEGEAHVHAGVAEGFSRLVPKSLRGGE